MYWSLAGKARYEARWKGWPKDKLPDPHVLYVVSAVVVLALVAWVIVVVTRAPPLQGPPAQQPPTKEAEKAPPAAHPEKEGGETADKGPDKASEPAAPRPSRSRLDSHLEIQDEKPGGEKTGEG
jgi:flagellar biosynthesis/type III secretory pathway M-ring protein FliF/YscJ